MAGEKSNQANFPGIVSQPVRWEGPERFHPEAIELFHETIRKQLAIDYSQVDFDGCLAGFFTHTTEELFKMGEVFDFGQQ